MKLSKKNKKVLNWIGLAIGIIGILVAIFGLLKSLGLV
jgi:hypothetical protein